MRIRTHTFIAALLIAVQLGCSDDSDLSVIAFNDETSITTLNGTWKVISFENYTTNTVEHKSQENSWNQDIIVTFDDTVNPKLFSGHVITNSVVGQFEYVGKRQFRMNTYGSTFVGQPEWGDKFGAAVTDDNGIFKINNTSLRIYYDSKSKSVTLVKQ